jgi:hypothetical protein
MLILFLDAAAAAVVAGPYIKHNGGDTDAEARRAYNRAVLMQGAQGDYIRQRAYNAYANCLHKTGDKDVARKHGMDVIQGHIFELFNIAPSPNRPPPHAAAEVCLGTS